MMKIRCAKPRQTKGCPGQNGEVQSSQPPSRSFKLCCIPIVAVDCSTVPEIGSGRLASRKPEMLGNKNSLASV